MGRKLRRKRLDPPVWSWRDQALWDTCEIVAALRRGDGVSRSVAGPVAPHLAEDEQFWAAGGFVLYDYRPLGDGSWSVSTPLVGGTGSVGCGLLVGSLFGRAVARRRAKKAAAVAAVPRWVPIEQGSVFVSAYGFYMLTPRVLSWSWSSITGATLLGPGQLHIAGDSQHGPVSWLLHSEWAELIFVTWALARHPNHPQLAHGSWLPEGWLGHAQARSFRE